MYKAKDIDYSIPIKGLSLGKQNFLFTIENDLFDEYDQGEILGAKMEVALIVEREPSLIEIEATFSGEVECQCDRCLEPLTTTLNFNSSLLVKFEGEDESENENENENEELLIVDANESRLNLKQFFYDYITLALPLQRVHKEGECNEEMVEMLKEYSQEYSQLREGSSSSPFEVLKDLKYKDKKLK